jgi:hypothetical protein
LHDEALTPKKPRPNFLENSIPTDTPLAAQRKELFWQITFPEIRLGQWEGFVQDKGRQTFPLLLFWLINAVMKRSRLLRLFYLHLKVCQINRIVVLTIAKNGFHLDIIVHHHKTSSLGNDDFGDPVLFRHIAFLDQKSGTLFRVLSC